MLPPERVIRSPRPGSVRPVARWCPTQPEHADLSPIHAADPGVYTSNYVIIFITELPGYGAWIEHRLHCRDRGGIGRIDVVPLPRGEAGYRDLAVPFTVRCLRLRVSVI
jgi:hypothetical protein